MMRWTNESGNVGAWMAVCSVVVGIALLACTVALIRVNYRDRPDGSMPDAERELRLRLARGEIDLDELLTELDALRR